MARPTDAALKELRAALQALLATLDDIDADDWGSDTTRDLRRYAAASLGDLDEGLLRTPVRAEVRTRLSRLGCEAALQQWADVWGSVPEWTETFARTEHAAAAVLMQVE